MDAHEIARRPSALPSRFATRVPPDTLEGLRLMEEGREYGELTVELAATLAHTRAIVTPAEQRELRELLAATDRPAWAGGQDPRDVAPDGLPRHGRGQGG